MAKEKKESKKSSKKRTSKEKSSKHKKEKSSKERHRKNSKEKDRKKPSKKDRSSDEKKRSVDAPISKDDYFLKSEQFRVWCKLVKERYSLRFRAPKLLLMVR